MRLSRRYSCPICVHGSMIVNVVMVRHKAVELVRRRYQDLSPTVPQEENTRGWHHLPELKPELLLCHSAVVGKGFGWYIMLIGYHHTDNEQSSHVSQESRTTPPRPTRRVTCQLVLTVVRVWCSKRVLIAFTPVIRVHITCVLSTFNIIITSILETIINMTISSDWARETL